MIDPSPRDRASKILRQRSWNRTALTNLIWSMAYDHDVFGWDVIYHVVGHIRSDQMRDVIRGIKKRHLGHLSPRKIEDL